MGRMKLTPLQQTLKAWLSLCEKIELPARSSKEKFYLKEENFSLLYNRLFSSLINQAGVFSSDQARKKLADLIDEMHLWERKKHRSTLEQACFFHTQLYFLELFPEYNGLFTRYMTDAFLFANEYECPLWNISQEKYQESLQHAEKGNYGHLVDIMIHAGCKKREIS